MSNPEEIIPPDPATRLADELVAALGVAAQNAVTAQQQLWTLGQAALVEALAKRLASTEPAATTPAEATPGRTKDLAALTEELQAAMATKAASTETETLTTSAADLPEELLDLMTSFSISLALLGELWTQQALDVVLAVIAAGIDVRGKNLDAAEARVLVTLLSGNRVVEMLAELESVGGCEVCAEGGEDEDEGKA